MGPLLLSRMMDLNDVQEGVSTSRFRVARAGPAAAGHEGFAGNPVFRRGTRCRIDHAVWKRLEQTVGTIQRQLLVLENQGGAKFFRRAGAGAEGIHAQTDSDGRA